MKKTIFAILMLLVMTNYVFAGQIIDRHTFFNNYDPLTSSFVYYQAANTPEGNQNATGDFVAVNTYTLKTIQVTATKVSEYVEVRIEGRSLEQTNTPNWAVLDILGFGAGSSDIDRQKVVDVTEYVDFLRVGVRQVGTNNVSGVDIRGLFTNLDR